MTEAASSARAATTPQKRLRQLRLVRTMEDLTVVCREARSLIKRGEIALPDAIDSLCEIAEASGLCARLGAEFVYEDIRRQLTATAAEETDPRPDYEARVVSAKDLQTMRFPPMRYVLPGLIPEGLAILAARPKAKKSWLMLDLAVAVAAGRFLLGDLKPAEGDVLYLALEDSRRRLQRRLDKLLGMFFAEWPRRLEIVTEWPRGDRGVADLDAWCVAHPNARLIVIDTFEKIRAPDGPGRLYGLDYLAIAPFHRIAHEHGIAVVLVHHTRKMDADNAFDTVSGSQGLTGAADTVLVIKQHPGGVTLHAAGRDIDESETAMQFDKATCRWTIVGALGGAVDVRISDERRRVLQALAEAGEAMSSEQIRRAAGLRSRNWADVLLGRMLKDRQVARVARGKYDLLDRAQSDRSDRSDCASGRATH
jgi:AAA domain